VTNNIAPKAIGDVEREHAELGAAIALDIELFQLFCKVFLFLCLGWTAGRRGLLGVVGSLRLTVGRSQQHLLIHPWWLMAAFH
jgi:hypothetical protein